MYTLFPYGVHVYVIIISILPLVINVILSEKLAPLALALQETVPIGYWREATSLRSDKITV